MGFDPSTRIQPPKPTSAAVHRDPGAGVYGRRWTELEHRSLIREQAFGESLKGDKLEVLARYEVHLDRKLDRTLTMLVRLKELRLSTPSQAG